MRKELVEDEAAACRKRAEEFAGRAEQPLLLNLPAAIEDLADGSHERSGSEQNEAGSNQPDHIRQAKRERVASVLITIMMITLWAILSFFAYFVS